jgi:hypothetical protein
VGGRRSRHWVLLPLVRTTSQLVAGGSSYEDIQLGTHWGEFAQIYGIAVVAAWRAPSPRSSIDDTMNLAWKRLWELPPKKPAKKVWLNEQASGNVGCTLNRSVPTRPRHRCPNALTVNPRSGCSGAGIEKAVSRRGRACIGGIHSTCVVRRRKAVRRGSSDPAVEKCVETIDRGISAVFE